MHLRHAEAIIKTSEIWSNNKFDIATAQITKIINKGFGPFQKIVYSLIFRYNIVFECIDHDPQSSKVWVKMD